jgi:hypothetical protein
MQLEDWNQLAKALGSFAAEILAATETRVEKNQELIVAGLYARAYQSFLGSILLADAGLTDDAATLMRSMTESTIALRIAGNDPEFILRLHDDEVYSLNPHERADRLFREVAAKELGEQEVSEPYHDLPLVEPLPTPTPHRIKWAEESSKEFLTHHLYNAHYRPLSQASHVSLVSSRIGDSFERIDWRPIKAETLDALTRACDLMIWATMSILGFMQLQELQPRFQGLRDQYTQMLDALPLP